jgi:hypothetical protein
MPLRLALVFTLSFQVLPGNGGLPSLGPGHWGGGGPAGSLGRAMGLASAGPSQAAGSRASSGSRAELLSHAAAAAVATTGAAGGGLPVAPTLSETVEKWRRVSVHVQEAENAQYMTRTLLFRGLRIKCVLKAFGCPPPPCLPQGSAWSQEWVEASASHMAWG